MMQLIHRLFLLAAACGVASCKGILFPRESETREVVSLDGIWKFSISPKGCENIGYEKEWFSTYHDEWISMPVPSSYNDITVNATIRDFVGWAWYQRTFFAPRRWKIDSQKVFLRFGSVHYTAYVWVNGELAGNHSGGHLPFVFHVTDLLLYGASNLVTVAVNNTLTQHTLPQGSVQHFNNSDMYPPGYVINSYNFDFFNYAGIHRPVYLFTTPQTYIDDISVITHVEGTTGIVEYEVYYNVCENDIPMPIRCEVTLLDGRNTTVPISLSCQGELRVENAKLWWPVHMSEDPGHLYTLQIRLAQDKSEDIYRLPVGIRTISWDRDLRINFKPVYLRGFGKHEDSDLRGKGLDYALLLRDHSLISWVGANCYRTSHYPYAEEAMDLADSLGIMVINESPAVNLDLFDPLMLAKHKAVMKEMLRRDKNRPSVVMWSLSNEARTYKKEAGPHYRAVVEYVKSLDFTRPITFVTNQDVDKDQAAPFMDVIGVNRYFSWYSDTGQLELVPHQVETEFIKWHETFKKPVFISEYGADSISGMHTLPSFVWSEDYQAALLHEHFKAFDRLREKGFFIGELIWNFADFATKQDFKRVVGNHKGIFTRERQPKEAAYVLRSRYQSLQECEHI